MTQWERTAFSAPPRTAVLRMPITGAGQVATCRSETRKAPPLALSGWWGTLTPAERRRTRRARRVSGSPVARVCPSFPHWPDWPRGRYTAQRRPIIGPYRPRARLQPGRLGGTERGGRKPWRVAPGSGGGRLRRPEPLSAPTQLAPPPRQPSLCCPRLRALGSVPLSYTRSFFPPLRFEH